MTSLTSPFRSLIRHPIFWSLVITVCSISIDHSSVYLSQINLAGKDFMLQLRHSLRKPPPEVNDLILVTVDDASTQKLKYKWPFPRMVYGKLVSNILAFQPKIIGFDFVFQGEDQIPGSDQILVDSLSKTGNVILASYLDHEGHLISPEPSILSTAYRTALVNKLMDKDGTIRRAPLFLKDPITKENRLSWETEIFLKAKNLNPPKSFENPDSAVIETNENPIRIPASRGIMDIDFTVTTKDLPTVSLWEVLEGKINESDFKGKIVLVGLTALALHDFHPTPLKILPGLVVNANVILTLLRQSFFLRIPFVFTWLLIFLAVWLIFEVTEHYSVLTSFFTVLAISVTFLLVGFLLLWWNIVWDLTVATFICLLAFFAALLYKQFQTTLENIRLQEESVRDPLTGFYTRRFLEVHLKLDVKKALSRGRNFGAVNEVSLVMIDLDNFKLVNDSFGHQEGDRVLQKLGASIRTSVRKDELVCRYGGDEFCVILPGASLQNAVQFAEKLRLLIAGDPELSYTTQAGVKSFRVTGSFGVASVKGERSMSAENLLKAADRALYRAKKGGRNQVCAFDAQRDVIEGK